MCTLLTNKRYELLYNCGIQLLHIGRPLAAFECLIEAVQVYHANPASGCGWLNAALLLIRELLNKKQKVFQVKKELYSLLLVKAIIVK